MIPNHQPLISNPLCFPTVTVPVAIILDLNKPFGATVRLIAPTSPKITLDAEVAGSVYVSTTQGSGTGPRSFETAVLAQTVVGYSRKMHHFRLQVKCNVPLA